MEAELRKIEGNGGVEVELWMKWWWSWSGVEGYAYEGEVEVEEEISNFRYYTLEYWIAKALLAWACRI